MRKETKEICTVTGLRAPRNIRHLATRNGGMALAVGDHAISVKWKRDEKSKLNSNWSMTGVNIIWQY